MAPKLQSYTFLRKESDIGDNRYLIHKNILRGIAGAAKKSLL
tara:strand:- start:328 stop:453 length:126 start_codon:yes stop_codon:yes gene_type:complete